MGITIGIDGSRNRSGGAKAHLIGILSEAAPSDFGVDKIHVWSYRKLLDALPDSPWLVKHTHPALERSLPSQLWWQFRQLPAEAARYGCDILLNTDAGSVCPFHPAVTMSRDMLSYEKGEMKRFGFSLARLRLLALKYVQTWSLKRADAAVFLTEYAAKVIQGETGPLSCLKVIPHGVGKTFRQETAAGMWELEPGRPVRCIYVSNASMYKHQWVVVRALAELRGKGFDLKLLLAGGGKGKAQRMMEDAIQEVDPGKEFIETREFVRHEEVPTLLADSDIFIFASSCENMPNTLVEGMASGLPIASSDRGPMPEVLKDGGVYFDPEDSASIANAVERLLLDRDLRISLAKKAKSLAGGYSWSRCSSETLGFLAECVALKGRSLPSKGLTAAGRVGVDGNS